MRKPATLNPLAEKILSSLSSHAASGEVVLGGYFALSHYLDYRATNDINGWWKSRADPATQAAVRDSMTRLAHSDQFELQERGFGETLSFELLRAGRREFSFQIAVRSIQLEPPQLSCWPPVLIETLADNVGSKMNALVDRGSPRDFSDIYRVVQSKLMEGTRCWELWHAKNGGASSDSARQKVLLHLSALEARRPLHTIEPANEASRARSVRDWFRNEFLKR